MKTSKIIFTSYFSLVGLILISIMISGFAFNHKNRNRHGKYEFINKSIPLENFKHIKINANCLVIIQHDSVSTINYTFRKNKETNSVKNPNPPKYNISGDTLILQSYESNNHINLHTKKSISITGNDCRITLKKLNQNNLSLTGTKCDLTFEDSFNVKTLKVSLDDSKMHYWNFKVQNLDLTLNQSRFYGNSRGTIKSFTAKISNNSDARLPKALDYNIKTDESSKVQLY